MKIKQTIEMPEGVVQFDGELSEAEVKLVMEVGLSTLFRLGAFSHIAQNMAQAKEHTEEVTSDGKTLN